MISTIGSASSGASANDHAQHRSLGQVGGALYQCALCGTVVQSLAECDLYRHLASQAGCMTTPRRCARSFPKTELLPARSRAAGYHSGGLGQDAALLYRCGVMGRVLSRSKERRPISRAPRTPRNARHTATRRTVAIQRDGLGRARLTDEEYGGDYLVADWVSQQLAKPHDKPFFWPAAFIGRTSRGSFPKNTTSRFRSSRFNCRQVTRPMISTIFRRGKTNRRESVLCPHPKRGPMEAGHPGLLGVDSLCRCDVGQVLAALDASPHARNTIVVLWSDHGWHLGEKNHWQKYTAWRACTRDSVDLCVFRPSTRVTRQAHASALQQAVNLVSLFSTLLDCADCRRFRNTTAKFGAAVTRCEF